MGYIIIDGELVHTSLLPRLNTEPLTWIAPEELDALGIFKKSKEVYDKTAIAIRGTEYKITNSSTYIKKVAPIKSDF